MDALVQRVSVLEGTVTTLQHELSRHRQALNAAGIVLSPAPSIVAGMPALAANSESKYWQTWQQMQQMQQMQQQQLLQQQAQQPQQLVRGGSSGNIAENVLAELPDWAAQLRKNKSVGGSSAGGEKDRRGGSSAAGPESNHRGTIVLPQRSAEGVNAGRTPGELFCGRTPGEGVLPPPLTSTTSPNNPRNFESNALAAHMDGGGQTGQHAAPRIHDTLAHVDGGARNTSSNSLFSEEGRGGPLAAKKPPPPPLASPQTSSSSDREKKVLPPPGSPGSNKHGLTGPPRPLDRRAADPRPLDRRASKGGTTSSKAPSAYKGSNSKFADKQALLFPSSKQVGLDEGGKNKAPKVSRFEHVRPLDERQRSRQREERLSRNDSQNFGRGDRGQQHRGDYRDLPRDPPHDTRAVRAGGGRADSRAARRSPRLASRREEDRDPFGAKTTGRNPFANSGSFDEDPFLNRGRSTVSAASSSREEIVSAPPVRKGANPRVVKNLGAVLPPPTRKT